MTQLTQYSLTLNKIRFRFLALFQIKTSNCIYGLKFKMFLPQFPKSIFVIKTYYKFRCLQNIIFLGHYSNYILTIWLPQLHTQTFALSFLKALLNCKWHKQHILKVHNVINLTYICNYHSIIKICILTYSLHKNICSCPFVILLSYQFPASVSRQSFYFMIQ